MLTGVEVEAMRKLAELYRDAQVDALRIIQGLRIKSWGFREIPHLVRLAMRIR
jgi:hypothetical protein